MFQIGSTIISEEILENEFVCNLSICKGACCVAGNAGAPIEPEEKILLEKDYSSIAPFLTDNGRKAIEKQGTSIQNDFNQIETPLVDGKECAFTVFEDDGTAKCGIEKAYNSKAIKWKKPISCHLYPIRLTQYSSFTAVNYHKWDICAAACSLGKELTVPVYKFLKEPLIRKFGEKWFKEVEKTANDTL